MPLRRFTGFGGRALLALSLITSNVFAGDSWVDFALNDAGEITLAPRTLAPSDYVMAVYAERLEDLPLSPAAAPRAPGALPNGCLPLVSIDTASRTTQLPREADLTFGCTDLPPNAQIHAWINNAWQPLPTNRLPDGRLHTRFTHTAVYGVFLVPQNPLI
jgi:hypothetical protein